MTNQLDPLEDLREQFVVAAHRQAAPPRHLRWWRPRVVAVVAVLLVTGAAAEAVDLVSIGTPDNPYPEAAASSGPAAGGGRIAVTSHDPGQRLPWAVVTYRRNGRPCATAGALRGNQLGRVRDGVFHPTRFGGVCGDLKGVPYVVSTLAQGGRTLLFGRAHAGIKSMVAYDGAKAIRTRTGPDGAFLFVFDGRLSLAGLRLEAKRSLTRGHNFCARGS